MRAFAFNSIFSCKLGGLIAAASLVIAVTGAVAANPAFEPTLEIVHGNQTRHLARAELLLHPALRTIDVPADIAYRRTMRYQAVPFAALIAQPSQAGTMQFVASDGFVATIPAALLATDRGGSQAWLGIESPDAPWPALKPGGPSAGPFYLVWLAPEKSGISPEQWPYQVAKITDALPLETRFPQIVPKSSMPVDSPQRRGLRIFTTNCAVCHRINGGGDAQIGPDLNQPFGPTEYFQQTFLKRLIRDPGSVRNWDRRTMPGFSPAVISDTQLDELLAYLRQMAKERGRHF